MGQGAEELGLSSELGPIRRGVANLRIGDARTQENQRGADEIPRPEGRRRLDANAVAVVELGSHGHRTGATLHHGFPHGSTPFTQGISVGFSLPDDFADRDCSLDGVEGDVVLTVLNGSY